MSEESFQGAIVEYAVLLGYLAYHTHDSRRSAPGFPDLVLVRDERLLFAELKTDVGRVAPAQRDWLAALEATGVEVYVWRPKDWNQIIETLRRRPPEEAIAA